MKLWTNSRALGLPASDWRVLLWKVCVDHRSRHRFYRGVTQLAHSPEALNLLAHANRKSNVSFLHGVALTTPLRYKYWLPHQYFRKLLLVNLNSPPLLFSMHFFSCDDIMDPEIRHPRSSWWACTFDVDYDVFVLSGGKFGFSYKVIFCFHLFWPAEEIAFVDKDSFHLFSHVALSWLEFWWAHG